jgi:hypothetical protein
MLALTLAYPDYSSIESMLANILALLQAGKDKGITAADLQALADQLGCTCPTQEQITAAILTAMASDDDQMSEITDVLFDIREALQADADEAVFDYTQLLEDIRNDIANNQVDLSGIEGNIDEVNELLNDILYELREDDNNSFFNPDYSNQLNQILFELRKLNSYYFWDELEESIDDGTTEFTEEFDDFSEDILDILSGLRGTAEFFVVHNAIRAFHLTILSPVTYVSDITIDLSHLGAGVVTIFKYEDFMEGGQFYEGIRIAKAFVSIVLVYGWLVVMRKRLIIMVEVAGYT